MYDERINQFIWATFKKNGICYCANVLKEDKKKQNTPLTKLLVKRIMSNKQNITYDIIQHDISRNFNF